MLHVLRTIPFEFHLGIGQMEEMATSEDFRIEAGTLEAHAQLPVPIATLRPREDQSSVRARCRGEKSDFERRSCTGFISPDVIALVNQDIESA